MSPPAANARADGRGRRLELHRAALAEALAGFRARPVATAMTLAVLALALVLPLLVAMGLRNLEGLGAGIAAARDLNVYLTPGLSEAAVERARDRVAALAGIASIAVRTPDEGLARLAELPGAAEVLSGLDANPLPHVLIATPEAALGREALRGLAAEIEALPDVDLVHHELAWRNRFEALLAAARRVLLLLAVLAAAGILLVVAQTVWAEVARRREEIAIVQMLGGGRAYIRRPFLYGGVLLGFGAALLASAVAGLVWFALSGPAALLAASYQSAFALRGPGAGALALTGLAGTVLGWIGAFVASTRELARGDRR
jgi:cell division transport system permease protein